MSEKPRIWKSKPVRCTPELWHSLSELVTLRDRILTVTILLQVGDNAHQFLDVEALGLDIYETWEQADSCVVGLRPQDPAKFKWETIEGSSDRLTYVETFTDEDSVLDAQLAQNEPFLDLFFDAIRRGLNDYE